MKAPITALSAVALLSTTASAFPNPFSSSGSQQQQLRFGLPSHHEPDALERVIDAMQGAVKLAEQKGGRWATEIMAEADKLVDEMEAVGAKLGMAMTGLGRPDKRPVPTAKVVDDGATHVQVDGVTYERITSPLFPKHALRVHSPSDVSVSPDDGGKKGGLCDPTVKQWSGYLDISETKHLFFWFFESRSSPDSDPLVLWLNGGPGCSSSTGLLMELGPCNVDKDGADVTFNKHGWNSRANLIFLDQPVAVGYSYTDGGDSINNSADGAKDVYAFLQLFYQRFPKYKPLPFTVAGESYGGMYIPNIATEIHTQNSAAPASSSKKAFKIPLDTIMIGNGLTDPYVQFATIPDYACDPSPYAVFDEATCTGLRGKVPTCQRLQKYCYDSPSRFTCVPATFYCWSAMYGPFQSTGLNPYDVRKKCDRNANPLCYEEMNWIETYLNSGPVKKSLGVPESVTFQSCNFEVNRAFQLSGDNMHDSAALIGPLVEDGVRVLIYAGREDFMCEYLGNEAWMLNLDTSFTKAFANSSGDYFSSSSASSKGKKEPAGKVRSAGPGAGNYTFVSLYDAGHMVPHDQPAVALDLLDRWLANEPLL